MSVQKKKKAVDLESKIKKLEGKMTGLRRDVNTLKKYKRTMERAAEYFGTKEV